MLVEWKVDGVLVREGMGYVRQRGQEDIMTPGEAKAYIVCGMVREISTKGRQIIDIPVLILEDEDEPDNDYSS